MVVNAPEVGEEEDEDNVQDQGEAGMSDDPDLRMDDEMRSQFPMNFGEPACGLQWRTTVQLQMSPGGWNFVVCC